MFREISLTLLSDRLQFPNHEYRRIGLERHTTSLNNSLNGTALPCPRVMILVYLE